MTFATMPVAVLIFAIGLIVLSKNNKVATNKLFFGFCFTFSFWTIITVLEDVFLKSAFTKLLISLDYAVAGFIAYFFLLFIKNFPQEHKDKNQIYYIFPTLFFAFSSFINLLIQQVSVEGNELNVSPGLLYFPYVIYLILYVVTGLYLLYQKRKHSKGLLKAQINYLLFGFAISGSIILITDLILPFLLNNDSIFRVGILSFIVFIATTAYAIVAHQLFDIRVIIRRTVVYSGLLLFTLCTYSLIIFFFSSIFGGENTFNAKTFIANFIAAILIAVGFEPLHRWLTNVTDKYLFKGEYDPQAVLGQLSQQLSSSLDLQQVSQSLVTIIKAQMRLSHTAVVVFSVAESKVVVKGVNQDGYPDPSILQLPSENLLLQFCARTPQLLITEDIRRLAAEHSQPMNTDLQALRPLLVDLEKLQVAMVIPILVDKQAIGMFLVGEKLSGDTFTKDDLNFLGIVASQTANTIEKTRFWEEDQMKSEFVSIASHELLTPTAAMKGYLSMILDDHMGQVDDTSRRYLEKVASSADRLAKLVENLLNVSRIESGRLKVNKQAFSLVESAQKAVDELQISAKNKGLDVKFVAPVKLLPQVYADPDHIYRVLVNLIGNSIKYTNQGWVRCFVTQQDATHLLFSVSDSGVGIPQDAIPHLFEKFNRADRKEIAGVQGTGLGLYISKKIIELMGGQMWVQSENNKGTTFYFTLPIMPAIVTSESPSRNATPQPAAVAN